MGSTPFSLGSISIIGQSELPAPAWLVLRLFILVLRLFVLRLFVLRLFVLRLFVLRLRGSEVDKACSSDCIFPGGS
jgi:hypothetical protein